MNEPSPKARFEIDRALLKGERTQAMKIHRDDMGEGFGAAAEYIESREAELREQRPYAFRDGDSPRATRASTPVDDGKVRRGAPFGALVLATLALLVPMAFLLPLDSLERSPEHWLEEQLYELEWWIKEQLESLTPYDEIEAVSEAERRLAEEIAMVEGVDRPSPLGEESAPPILDVEPRSATPRARPEVAKAPTLRADAPMGELMVDLYRDFRYQPTGFPFRLATGHTALPLHPRLDQPPRHEPIYLGTPRYARLPLGSDPARRALMAFDPGGERWRFYVDRNLNGDLTDDGPPVEKGPNKKGVAGVELDLNVALLGEAATRPYRIWFFARRDGEGWKAAFYARCHYAGRVRVGGGEYDAVAFEQRNHNALLREDGLWIDLDRDGKLSDHEHFDDGDRIQIGEREYPLRLAYR